MHGGNGGHKAACERHFCGSRYLSIKRYFLAVDMHMRLTVNGVLKRLLKKGD